jgi:hypothetical protein
LALFSLSSLSASGRKARLCTRLSFRGPERKAYVPQAIIRGNPQPRPWLPACFLEASPIQPRTAAARLPMRTGASRSVSIPSRAARSTAVADGLLAAPRARFACRFRASDKIPRPFCTEREARRGGRDGAEEEGQKPKVPPESWHF